MRGSVFGFTQFRSGAEALWAKCGAFCFMTSISNVSVVKLDSKLAIGLGKSNEFKLVAIHNPHRYERQIGTLTATDENGDRQIKAGETVSHDNPDLGRKDAIPDLDKATVVGVGSASGWPTPLSKEISFPVIVVEQGGKHYLLFPETLSSDLDRLFSCPIVKINLPKDGAYPVTPPTCFTAGTLIETDRRPVAVEDLVPGDLVMTCDNGLQPLRWTGGTKLDRIDLAVAPQLRPIRIKAGALGAGMPTRDLLVSPQHRVLVRSVIAQRMFGTAEVLVAAKQLVLLDGVDVAEDVDSVHYLHLLFDRHEILVSNGAQTESLYTGLEALKRVGAAARAEIAALFPQLLEDGFAPASARPLVSGRMGRKMAQRHHQNSKALVA